MPVTAARANEYRALLGEASRMAQEDLVALWRRLEHLDPQSLYAALRDGVPEVVGAYRAMTADTALVFYEETQGLAFDAAEARAAGMVNRAQLDASLRWAIYSGGADVLGKLAGVVQKHVIDGSRQYALSGFHRQGSLWVRSARPQACEFCRMLATRAVTREGAGWGPYVSAAGAVTVGAGKSKQGQSQPTGTEFHDHCMCIPVLASEYEPPSYVGRWAGEYYAAVDEVGNSFDYKAILSVMRKNAK